MSSVLDTSYGSVTRRKRNENAVARYVPEAERVLIELLRQAPAWRKLRMVEDTNRSVKDLLLAG